MLVSLIGLIVLGWALNARQYRYEYGDEYRNRYPINATKWSESDGLPLKKE